MKEETKNKLKKIGKIIYGILSTIFFGFAAIFMFNNKKNNDDAEKKAKSKKEETKNELEKKSADDIANDSPNPDAISSGIKQQQEEFRERVRNRLNKNL